MTRIITVDLDSTLYDTTHRHNDLEQGLITGDWVAYSKLCVSDSVVEGVAAMVHMAHAAGVGVHYVTGRSVEAEYETRKRLMLDKLPIDGLWMDETPGSNHVGIYGSHAAYKVDRILGVIARLRAEHLFHVDDYSEVSVGLAKAGLACITVRAPHEVLAGAGILA